MCGPSGIDAALETVQGLDRQLSDYCNDAKNDRLQPLPGQTMKSCAQELGATSKMVGASMAQLLTAAAQVRLLVYQLRLFLMVAGLRCKIAECNFYNTFEWWL